MFVTVDLKGGGMWRSRMALLTLAAVVFLTGAIASAEPPDADPNRAAMEKAGAAFSEAFNRGDVSAVAAMYDEAAIVLPPDEAVVQGRPAIEALWKAARDSGMKNLAFTVLDVRSSGDFIAEVGTADFTMKPANGAESAEKAKYLVVWKRQPGGGWKLFRDIWNAMPPSKK